MALSHGFARIIYKDILTDSIRYCQKNKGLELYRWVIMTNHVHMIISATQAIKSEEDTAGIKKFTSVYILFTSVLLLPATLVRTFGHTR